MLLYLPLSGLVLRRDQKCLSTCNTTVFIGCRGQLIIDRVSLFPNSDSQSVGRGRLVVRGGTAGGL